jgi:glucokinase
MPPAPLASEPEIGGHFVGVDVGGTKVAVATVDDEQFGEPSIRPTEAASTAGLIDEIVAVVEAARTRRTRAVGIGVPSIVELETGRVRSSVNLHLANFDLRGVLESQIGLPVFVDNDATVAAIGEAFDDGGRPIVQNLVMLTIGTGVGGGLVLGGRVYRGSTGAAAELGHTMVGASLDEGTPVAGQFPQRGSLEALASGRVLDHMAAEIAVQRPESALGSMAARGERIDGHDVVRAARDGDPDAAGALRVLGERLGIGIANAINTFDPDEVVIGGGVSVARDLLLAPARETARQFVLPGVLFGLSYAFLFEAYYRGRVTIVSPLVATESLFGVAFSVLLLRRSELVGRHVAFGAALIVGGAALIGATR